MFEIFPWPLKFHKQFLFLADICLSNFVCGLPSFPVVPRHPGTLQDLQLFRRWAVPLGSSCRYLLALTCSVFSPGQAKEEETTNKEREQGSQSQRWAWERTLPSSALRQPVRRRWSQGESAWIAVFPGFLGLYCYYGNSRWEAPLANVRGVESSYKVHSHKRLAGLQKKCVQVLRWKKDLFHLLF